MSSFLRPLEVLEGLQVETNVFEINIAVSTTSIHTMEQMEILKDDAYRFPWLTPLADRPSSAMLDFFVALPCAFPLFFGFTILLFMTYTTFSTGMATMVRIGCMATAVRLAFVDKGREAVDQGHRFQERFLVLVLLGECELLLSPRKGDLSTQCGCNCNLQIRV